MGKLIEFDDQARDSLRRGVDQLAGAVRVTLGPRGRNVVIERLHGTPAITSDGLAIAREIELENRFENLGAQLVREVAIKTGEVAGDGTTTATVLAHGIVTGGLQAVTAGHNPMALKRGIERAVHLVVEDLRRQARAVQGRADLERVAGVSANDPRIGAVVAEAFDRVGPAGVVTVDEGRGLNDTLEVVEGVRLDHGYVSPYFVTRGEDMTVTLEHPFVLLTALRLTAAQEVLGILEHAAHAGRPLLVIAEDVEAEALATLVVNRLRGAVSSVAVRLPRGSDRDRALLQDLGVLTGATVVTPEMGRPLERFGPEDLGRAQRVIVDRDTTTIVKGGGDSRIIRDRMTTLQRAASSSTPGFERDELRQRVARLAGGIAVVRVVMTMPWPPRARRSKRAWYRGAGSRCSAARKPSRRLR
jgi:chaperonin GroEL